MAMNYKLVIEYMQMLGLPTNQFITDKNLKKQYRDKARIYHPDTATDPKYRDGKMFYKLKEAKEFLTTHMVSINENIINIDYYAANPDSFEVKDKKKNFIICPFCGARNNEGLEVCECCGTSLKPQEKEQSNEESSDNTNIDIKEKKEYATESHRINDFLYKFGPWILASLSLVFGIIGLATFSFVSVFGLILSGLGVVICRNRAMKDYSQTANFIGFIISAVAFYLWFMKAIIFVLSSR